MIIEVYSDGSSDGKTGGIGGWAFVVIVDGVKTHEDSGSEPKATNNIVEILAAAKGLEYVNNTYSDCKDVTLISDSQLVLKFATGEYIVKKMHLLGYVLKLKQHYQALKATTRWVKGHSGDEHNERCDELAKSARSLSQSQIRSSQISAQLDTVSTEIKD